MNNVVIIDGKPATKIPESWQKANPLENRILELERENADLRLHLEQGVRLRAELADALADWAADYPERVGSLHEDKLFAAYKNVMEVQS